MYDDSVLLSMRFPQKLWRIVNECKTGAIRWSLNGGTILLDYKKFQEEYLNAPNSIFKTNNITSFIRQLNLYGFRKVTSHNRDPMCNSHNPDVHEFLHENFRSNRTDLLTNVCRRTGAGKIRFYQKIRGGTSMKNDIGDKVEFPSISRLQMCKLALRDALEEAMREYHRQRFWEELPINNENNHSRGIITSSRTSSDEIDLWLASLKFRMNKVARIHDSNNE